MKNIFKALLLSALVMTGCGSDDDGSPQGGGGEMDIFANTSASYTLTFETNFPEDMFPTNYPDNPSFGTIVAIIHGPEISVFELGQLASAGMQAYAEDGDVDALASFINTEVGMQNEGIFSIVTRTAIGPESSESINLTFTPSRTRVTFLAKLNPSPDWFLGVSSFDIVNTNQASLVQEAFFDLVPIDAGTAAGNTYEAPDEPENNVISAYIGSPFGEGPFASNIGALTLTRN